MNRHRIFAHEWLRSMARLGLVCAAALGLWTMSASAATGRHPQDPNQVTPKAVLVLPIVNSTGEKWEDLKKRINEEIDKALAQELKTLGFDRVTEEATQTCIKGYGVDLADEESWKRDVFYDLGKAANAEYVIFAVVTSATQRMRVNFLSSVPEGDVTIKFWILNSNSRVPLLSAKSINAKARAKSNLFGEAKGSECQVEAARRAVKEAIKEAFGEKKPPAK